jgi:serine phosphatase RsbU (regulator of sigma subunit)
MYLRIILLWILFAPLALAQVAVTNTGERLTEAICLQKAKEQEGLSNFRQASWYLNQAAMMRWEAKEYDLAIQHFERSLALNEKIGNEHGALGICSNLGMIYADKKEYERAYSYFARVLKGRSGDKDKVSVISAHINTAVVLNNLSRHTEAASNLEKALDLAREMNDADQMKSCYGMLSETYEKAGNTERSIYYFNLYRTFHEMVQRDKEEVYKTKEAEARLQAQILEAERKAQDTVLYYKERELERKQRELQEVSQALIAFDSSNRSLLENATKAELIHKLFDMTKSVAMQQEEKHQIQLREQRLIQYALMAGVAASGLMLALVFRNNRQKKAANQRLAKQNAAIMEQQMQIAEQNDRLETAFGEIVKKNDKITQSISYAQRIQISMMPPPKLLDQFVSNGFVLFSPRDIVSGDFYWMAECQGKYIVAAADCTGHGVPGALVSMVAMNLLQQIVVQQGIYMPDQILKALDQGVNRALNQEDTQNKDGLDIGLVCIDKPNHKIHFAGAKNPLIYGLPGKPLEVVKADKLSIGGQLRASQQEKKFATHSIDLVQGMECYLFSDGVQDQFGGPQGQKLMQKGLIALLEANRGSAMQVQKDKIQTALLQWMGPLAQIDDMLIIGFQP